jgi:hypothetical protein
MGTRPIPLARPAPIGRLRESVADMPALSKAAADLCEEYGMDSVEDALDLAFRRVYAGPLEHIGNWLESLILNIGSGIIRPWQSPHKDVLVKIGQVETPINSPTWGYTAEELGKAFESLFASRREEEIVEVEKEVERMDAAGIPPHLMYEDVPVTPCEMLVMYEAC